MPYYRFESNGVGIYEAVERDCPRADGRRQLKPDGSWLNKIGEKYPGSTSFWTEKGLSKYLESGLQEWHRSVVNHQPTVLVSENLSGIDYEDDLQVIVKGRPLGQLLSWNEFATKRSNGGLIEKVAAYILRKREGKLEVLVFRHLDKKLQAAAGIQVPAGTVDYKESPEKAVIREIKEKSGLQGVAILQKLDTYILYRHERNEFHLRHVYLMAAPKNIEDEWIFTVSGGGEDHGLIYHFSWMTLAEARMRLTGSLGCSLDKIAPVAK